MIRPERQKSQLRRQGPTSRRPANQKPLENLKKKGNKRVKESKGIERLALPKVRRISPRLMPLRLMPLRLMLARPEKSGKKLSRKPLREDVRTVPAEEMLPKSRAITVIKRAIIPSTN